MTRLRWFVIRRLAGRRSRALMLIAVVGIGLAPLVGVLLEVRSAELATKRLGEELAGPSELRVVGSTLKGGLPAELPGRIGDIPGVDAVVGVAQGIGRDGRSGNPIVVLGVDCSASPLVPGLEKCDPTLWAEDGAPAFTSPELVRAASTVEMTGGTLDLASAVAVEDLQAVNDGRFVVTGLARGQQLLGRGNRLDVVYVVLADGADQGAVARALGERAPDTRVLTKSDPSPGPDVAGEITGLLIVVGSLGAVIAFLLARSIGRLLLLERQRDLAIERAVGRTRLSIWRDIWLEGLVYGLAGGAVAATLGVVVGGLLTASLSDLLASYTGTSVELAVSATSLVPALLGAVAVVAAAFSVPAWRALDVDISQVSAAQQGNAVRDERGRPMALISAAVALAAGLALSAAMVGRPGLRPTAATVSLVAVALVVVGGFTAASVSTPMLLRWAAKRSQSRPGARLFLANLAGNGSRVGGVSLGVAFTVALSVVLGGLAPAMATTVRDNASQLVGAGFAVNTVPFNDATMIDSKIGSDLLERIRTTVAPGTVSREAFILTRTRGLDIAVVASDTPGNRTTVIDGASVPEAISDGVAIGAPLARTLKLAVGDDLEIDTPSGPLTLPIRAVVEYLDNAGLIAIVNMASVDANWGYQAPDPLIVTPTPDQSVSAMRDQVLALDPRIRVADAASLAADSVASINEYLDPFSVLSRMLFIVVGAAATISVGLVAIQRRQEFATLVASGVSTAVLGAITTAEAAVLAGLGAFQGAAVGLLLAGPMRNATSFVVGVRPPPVLPLLPALVAGVAAFTIATAGAIPPAVRLRRIELIDALSGD